MAVAASLQFASKDLFRPRWELCGAFLHQFECHTGIVDDDDRRAHDRDGTDWAWNSMWATQH